MTSRSGAARGWSLPAWLAIVLSIGLMVLLNVVPIASNDVWLQIKVGQLIVDDGHIPQTVLFPFTAIRDNAFTAHEWLPSILFHEFVRAFGEGRLMLLQGAFGLLQFGLSCWLARRLSGSLGFALLAATLAMVMANYRYVLRPEMFALLLLVSLLLALTGFRETRRWPMLAWTFPIALIWANAHGSFLLGPLVAGLFAAGEGAQRALSSGSRGWMQRLREGWLHGVPYAVAVLAMLAASVVNPRGIELLRFAFDVQGSEAMRATIKEWLPTFHPLFMMSPGFWIFVVVGACALGLIAALWRRLTVTDALLFAAFAFLALQRNRHIVWFGFVALTVCAHLVGRARAAAGREKAIEWGACVLAVIGLAACVQFGNVRGAYPYFAPSNNFSPPMVAELARADVVGNVFNSYELGSEIIYRDWPRLKPVIDSRIDSYGDDYYRFFNRLLVEEPLLVEFLRAANVDHMLLLRRDFDLRIKAMPGIASAWHIRLADDRMVLLERNVPSAPARALASAAGAEVR